ncbi:MAG: carbon-nitrogen hydrolase [Epsilonproteobacteria bacterium]|nr:carbon-nitrogen hydrolase [Campylobacterota bacterium]NPA57501.1 carbon-nitrogen hydrolase [Campylobacterota bacterium]
MRVALIQQRYHGSKEATTKKTLDLINRVEGVDLVLLQELHQAPYFCQEESTDWFTLAQDFEIDLEFWRWVSEERRIVLVASLFEQRAPGLYHNTAVVFDKGKIAGRYRKMHIPDDPGFYEKFYFTPGDLGFEPIETSVGRLGVLICWDQWFPEAARIMALKGAQILLYPTAIGWFDDDPQEEQRRQLEAWITIQRSHAIANGLPLVAVNRVGFEEDRSGCLKGIRFWGNSFACGPQGELLIQLSTDQEESGVVEIDLDRSREVREIWPFLRDRRIEAYSCLLERYCDGSEKNR